MTPLNNPEEANAEEATRPAGRTVVQEVSIEISGAIPHPHLLTSYNQVVPNGADRIVTLVEAQVHHRQSMEARAQVLTFVLAIVTLVGGISLIALGKGAQGLVPLVAAVAGLGGLFVYRGLRSKRS